MPECVLQLPLHGLHVRVLDQEGGTELTELSYLNLTRAVLVDLLKERLQLLLGGTEAHGPHDLAEIVGGEEILLLRVEQIKANLQTFDLINSEPGGVGDLLEVDVGVGVGLGHPGLWGDVRGSGSLETTAEAKRGVREGLNSYLGLILNMEV